MERVIDEQSPAALPGQPGPVYVFDLDGVIRRFDSATSDAPIESALGLPAGSVSAAAFDGPELVEVVEGRMTYAAWGDTIRDKLTRASGVRELDPGIVTPWLDYHGQLVAETVELIDELNDADHPVFVFTNGTDNIPVELATHDLGRRFRRVLNSSDFGVRKPALAAFERAHAAIEETLRHPVERHAVRFTDDRLDNVDGARQFGWTSEVFTTASALKVAWQLGG